MRGIPYHRSHMYIGPPGNGKSSLTMAVAGEFGLNIYCLSLSDKALTDIGLQTLYNRLSNPSILLLEDIDTIGFTKKKNGAMEGSVRPEGNTGISLSGLLNILDGVGSAEGVLTIVTTNKPDSTDELLTLPGRIDKVFDFRLPVTAQVRDTFIKIYDPKALTSNVCNNIDVSMTRNMSNAPTPLKLEREVDKIRRTGKTSAELVTMAQYFVTGLQEQRRSAAEIQEFLLQRKHDPDGALTAVGDW